MSRNVLDLKKSHLLTNYLKDNIEQLKDLTMEKVAEMASEALGFAVTGANVTHIRDTFDLNIGRTKQQPAAPDQIEELRAQMVELSHRVSLLNVQVRRCLQHLEDHGETDIPAADNPLPSQLTFQS